MFKGRNFSWNGSSTALGAADVAQKEPSADLQRQTQAAAGQLASLIVFDARYPRAIAFVSDASENDELASMLMQVADASRTPVQMIRVLVQVRRPHPQPPTSERRPLTRLRRRSST